MIGLPNPISLHAFIYSFNKYLLSTNYVLGTVLGAGDTVNKNIGNTAFIHELQREDTDNKQDS